MISHLVDINTAIIISKINCSFRRNIFLLIYHSAQQVIDLNIQAFFIPTLNIEIYHCCSWIRVELNYGLVLI